MKFSTRTRYGIRTMLEIASDETGNGVMQKDIADKQELSVKYLDHIIAALKAAGLIVNVKGKKSGYRLTRNPSDISILDIHIAFEKGICVIDCVALEGKCKRKDKCKSQVFWQSLNEVVMDHFKSTTLANLMNVDTSES